MSAYTPGQNLIGTAGNFGQQPTVAVQTNGTYPSNSEYYHSQAHPQPTPTDPMHARPPRVDDALSYLDNVRQQFADNPQVYNDFLEVMREFKSHEIDTRGVIHRVSQLFSGHANLITGFNTFLPQGYEVRVSGSCIRIIQPSGEMAPIDASLSLAEQENMEMQPRLSHLSTSMTRLSQQHTPAHHGFAAPPSTATVAPAGSVVGEVQPKYSRQIHSQQPPSLAGAIHQPTSYPTGGQVVGYATVAAAGGQSPIRTAIGSPSGGVVSYGHAADALQSTGVDTNDNKNFEVVREGSQQPLHFDQAVGYLQKVKERFVDRPNIYQEFLSILGNYQKISSDRDTGQSITEGDVFKAVEQLFADEEDLMRDFSSYLPDASGGGSGDVSIKIPKEEPKSAADAQPAGDKSAGGGKSSKKRLIETPISPATAAKVAG